MNKYDVYLDIEKRLINCNDWTRTKYGKFLLAIVCQRIKDAMGLLRANKVKPRNSDKTHQELAIDWFRAKEHFPLCDVLDVEPSWVTWLLRTKGGVEL